MKKQRGIMNIFIITTFLLILNVSYSSDIKPIKPVTTDKTSRHDDPVAQSENRDMYHNDRFINHLKSMDYPIRDSILTQKSIMNTQIIKIKKEIILYKQVYGHFPDSITTLVESGFLLHWPRNPLDGKPAKLIKNRSLNTDRSDFSSFTYEVLNDYQMSMRCTSIDRDHYKQTGEEIWRVISNDYDASAASEAHPRQRYVRNVMGGTKKIHEIEQEDIRLLIALCANFNRILFSNTTLYYSYVEQLPTTLEDILFNDHFIIKENFEKLKHVLKSANVDLKWGFDRAKSEIYFIFDIDGERFIKHRGRFGEKDGSFSIGAFHPRKPPYNMVGLDMSSPIISSENIESIEIPEEYLISIKDIPLNGG